VKRSRWLRRSVPAAQCGEKNLAQSRLKKVFEIVDATRFNFPEADFWTGTSSGLHRDLTETGAYDAHGRRNSQVRISGQWTTPHWEAKAEMPRRYIAPRF
jgi:hypothetical protein